MVSKTVLAAVKLTTTSTFAAVANIYINIIAKYVYVCEDQFDLANKSLLNESEYM